MIEETVNVSQEAGDATLTASPDPLTFIAVGETKVLTIESNTSWTATKDADWLTLSPLSGSENLDIDVVAAENTTASERTATITITDDGGSLTEMVSVSQAALPMITSIAPESGAVGDQVTITGTGFSTTASVVTFLGDINNQSDNVQAVIATTPAPSATFLVVAVPQGAVTGAISVMVDAVADTSAVFTVVLQGGGTTFSVTGSERGLQIYPNPTYGEVRFAGLSALLSYRYKVYALVGQRVASGIFQGGKAIDLSTLPSGQYVLVLEDEENSEVLRTRLLVLK